MKKKTTPGAIVLSAIGLAVVIILTTKPSEQKKHDDTWEVDTLNICSFNIMWLGTYTKKDHIALADMLQQFDIILIQELTSPPTGGSYPDGEDYEADAEAKEFLDLMTERGFNYVLSEEDTGPGETIHTLQSRTEWWIAFFRPEKVEIAEDLPKGFLADDRSANPDFERVPYAFPFRVVNDTTDFVLISVHLAPDKEGAERRKHELNAIAEWIDNADSLEKDFILLGDMNIQDSMELVQALPQGYISLNSECIRTNTNINTQADQGARPYDHIVYRPGFSANLLDVVYDMKVLDLVELMKPSWKSEEPFPGDPYDRVLFQQYYSDHHPVCFRIVP